ncbi:retrovirus-related pol polyprotein from transposon TNT 1-94 [Tanacetum coccineum]
MSVLSDDQMNSVINFLTDKSTWDDLILYHEGPSDMKENRIMDLKLCYNTFKFKEGESLTQTFTRYKALMIELVNDGINLSKLKINIGFINGLPKKWLNSPDDEEDTRSSHEYLNDLEEEYQVRALLANKKGHFARDYWSKTSFPSYQSPFQSKSLSSPQHKPKLRASKDFKDKYNKVKGKLALLSLSASASKASTVKNKGLIDEAYEWDEEEVSSNDNDMVEVKMLMALAEDNDAVSKEGAKNGECVKISMRKVHTLLKMEDNDDRKTYLDYLCIDLNYIEGQRNNLLLKHKDLVHELNACKEQLLVLKQAKLDFLTLQHINTKILKENKNLRTELKELTAITKTWINSSNKVNQCISEQIPSQKKRVMGIDQLTEDASSSGQKDLVFVKSSDTGRILPAESQRNTTDPSVVVTDSSTTKYDSADESLSKSTFKDETLKGVIINEPSSAPVKGNKNSSASVVNSASAGKLKSVKIEDDPPLTIVMKELNNLKLQFSKNQSSYSRSNQPQQVPQNALQNKYKTQFKRSYDLCGLNNHLTENCYKVLFCKRCEKTDHKTCDHAEYISTMNMSQHLKSLARASSRSKILRPSKRFFPPCTHCGACGSSTHTTTGHYDIEWFKKGEALQAKKAETLKSTRCDIRKPIWYLYSGCSRHITSVKSYLHKYVEQPGPKVVFRDDSTCTTEGYGSIKCNGIVFTKVAFVDGLKYNLISISQLCDAKYIVQFDEKRGTIFNSNKEVVMIAPRVNHVHHVKKGKHHRASFKTKQTSSIKKCLHLLHMDLFGPVVTPRSINHEKYNLVIVDEYSRHSESSILEDNKVKKPITSHLMKALMLSNSQNLQLTTSTLMKIKDIHLMNIFILMSLHKEDTSVQNTIPIPTPPLPIPSIVTQAPQDRWSQDKHIELVNIIDFISEEEPKKVSEALKHPGWVDAMQDKLNQFARNKARRVAQDYNQQEGIDYDETFSPVARLEATRIFLAFATYMNFIVYQIDIKSAFLNGKLKKEVYVKQPPGFESNEFPTMSTN